MKEERYDIAIRPLESRLRSLELKLGRLQHMVDQLAAQSDQFRLKPPSGAELHAEMVKPDWLRITAAMAYSGLGRSMIYNLMDNKRISSILIKTDKRNVKGIRLISRASLDALMRGLTEEQ
jgi:hypothetical protein